MNTTPYRLEHGYELGFGPSVYDTMAEVILAFSSSEKDILFSFANWDKDLAPERDYMIKESAYSFHSDIIHDPDQKIAKKVKEILLQHDAPDRIPKDNPDLMDQMLADFKDVPFDQLNEDLVMKIGTIVFDMKTIYTLNDRDEITRDFVNKRLVETNTTWLYPYERPSYLINLLWYRANTKEDILLSFNLTDWWFSCVIVSPNTGVEEYSYFLSYSEEHGEEHDGMVLCINVNNKEHFQDFVLPPLQLLLGDRLEIVI